MLIGVRGYSTAVILSAEPENDSERYSALALTKPSLAVFRELLRLSGDNGGGGGGGEKGG